MTRQEFIKNLKHPVDLKTEDLAALKDLAIRFPYSASAQILYAYCLYKKEDVEFTGQWKKMAAYASNRRKIKMDLDLLKTARSLKPKPIPEKSYLLRPETHEPSHEDELLMIVRRRLAEIKAEREESVKSGNEKFVEEDPVASLVKITRNELVEKFTGEILA